MGSAKWMYRRRSGWRLGKLCFGYERRDYYYQIKIPVFLAWPIISTGTLASNSDGQ